MTAGREETIRLYQPVSVNSLLLPPCELNTAPLHLGLRSKQHSQAYLKAEPSQTQVAFRRYL